MLGTHEGLGLRKNDKLNKTHKVQSLQEVFNAILNQEENEIGNEKSNPLISDEYH